MVIKAASERTSAALASELILNILGATTIANIANIMMTITNSIKVNPEGDLHLNDMLLLTRFKLLAA
ncbi:hypothetical protein TUM4261_09590 [Shewanella sp. c952]|nr:hypothetical protein TUM4261_09590 [Shewanella sp. c952]